MGKNWAIAVGINRYSNLTDLKYAKKDAEAVKELLLSKVGFGRVFLFTDDSPEIPTNSLPICTQPTYGHLRRFIRAQFSRKILSPGDNLWFFFAGHGIRENNRDYLMLSDSDPGDVEHTAIAVVIALGQNKDSLESITPKSKTSTKAIPQTSTFEFETVEVNGKGLIKERENKKGKDFKEDLGNGVSLEMVEIPDGSFTMGSPKEEKGSSDNERPKHEVRVSSFFMGKFQVTQAQWKAVAKLPQVERELKPEPSNFKGENRPVEQVSWNDAVEFCGRLSKHTGREYRLPSEAEWEYACRGGTTTPFHFGETITTDLANYRGTDEQALGWSGSYGDGPKGVYRQETTDVGSFDAPNALGLHDMHGNVWEWCFDDWHGNYEKAPTDGSAWVKNDNDNRSHSKVLRGGSWNDNPEGCRSAFRLNGIPENRYNDLGFRVVCAVAQRIL